MGVMSCRFKAIYAMFWLTTTKAQRWDYFILAARGLLAYTFISYGYGKLTGGQFGLTAD